MKKIIAITKTLISKEIKAQGDLETMDG